MRERQARFSEGLREASGRSKMLLREDGEPSAESQKKEQKEIKRWKPKAEKEPDGEKEQGLRGGGHSDACYIIVVS